MKESGYNFFVEYEPDNILLGYNCVSGGLLVFPAQQHDDINIILKDSETIKGWCNPGRADKYMIRSIGENGGIIYSNHKNILKWMSWVPVDIDKYKKCKILSGCMGGCMYYNVMGETDKIGVGCSQRKYNISHMMKLYYEFCKKNAHYKLQDIDLLKKPN
jgi:radical SAM protein with 4Fe4S-binding SPASM domain